MERTAVSQFLDDFLRQGEDVAYIERDGYRTLRHTYRQVAETAFQFARELQARNISKGDCILLWGPNSAAWVAAFFGCAAIGVIVVPMDDAASADFALRVFHQVKAKLLVCSRTHQQDSVPILLFEDFNQTLARHDKTPVLVDGITRQDTLQVVFTSGTTAEPKGVIITHGNVLSNIAPLETEIQKYLSRARWFHPIHFLNLLPLSHVFGQFLGLFLPRILRATVIFQESFNPAEILSTIKRERVSVLVAVPQVLQSLKEKVERALEEQGKLARFRQRFESSKPKHFLHRSWIFRRIRRQFGWKFWAFICGGAALDSTTEEFWQRLGIAVVQGYGLTETTSLISVNHPFRVGKGSIGKVLAGREVKLSDDGEILVRGGGVASGYWSADSTQPMTAEQGWYRTGDLGELDAQGNLYFKGRKKDVIVTPAGMNIYPDDLEAALRRQPEVKDCVVVSLPIDGNAEPYAVLILRSGDARQIVAQANQSLAEYQRIRHWQIWPEEDFPRTATQKPRRNLIQQAVIAQLDPKTATPNSPTVLADLIARVRRGSAPEVSPSANLEDDLNLSSLERVELLGALEDRYQLDLSETNFAAVQTVADIERLIHGEVQPKAKFTYPRWTLRWPFSWIRIASQYLLGRPAVFLLGWPKVKGKENLRGVRGPVLIVCNHISHVDVGFVHKALPPLIRHFLATAAGGEVMQSLRTPPPTRNVFARVYDRARWFLGVLLLNLFPLPRTAGFRESFAYAGECVDRGYSVLVFPEGRHTTDGKLNPFRSGVGLLANNLKIPIVPMRIDGLFELKQAGKHFARPGKIRVTIGLPVAFPPNTSPETIAQQLHRIIEEM